MNFNFTPPQIRQNDDRKFRKEKLGGAFRSGASGAILTTKIKNNAETGRKTALEES